MTAPLTVNPGVLLPASYWRWPMAEAVVAIMEEAPASTRGAVLTSGFRPGDPNRHGEAKAVDADTLEAISLEEGERWAARVQKRLGPDFDVIWHKRKGGAWHLHAESEHAKRRSRWTPGQLARLKVLEHRALA